MSALMTVPRDRSRVRDGARLPVVAWTRFAFGCSRCVHVLNDRTHPRCAFWHTLAGYPLGCFDAWREGGGKAPSGLRHDAQRECPAFEHAERREPFLRRLARGLGFV